MTAIAANRQVRRQLGEITVRTMSAADMNSNPRINHMPKRRRDCFLPLCDQRRVELITRSRLLSRRGDDQCGNHFERPDEEPDCREGYSA